ncbi:MAG: hypothetical protein LBU60_01420, partial [Clostridiales bacterium]|jgi:hypothetical protein|nr:hypothetical protein [Clostridiales bacterium]
MKISFMSNGSVYGMNSYDFSVNPDNKLSIDMSFILDKEKNVNVDPRAVKLAEDIYNAKTNGEFVNRDPDSEYTMRMFPRQYGVLFGEDNNDQIYTHVNAQGVEIKYDHVDYSFLPKNADGTNDMTYVGSWNRIEFLNEVIPWLERYLLDLHGQVPLYMDTQANLVSHRFETPLDGPDAILFRAGSFRLSKMTMNDGQWARSINGTRNRNRLMQSYFL